jgi:hypothetical protein
MIGKLGRICNNQEKNSPHYYFVPGILFGEKGFLIPLKTLLTGFMRAYMFFIPCQ